MNPGNVIEYCLKQYDGVTKKTFEEFEPMIRESYEYAIEKFSKRKI